MKKELLFIALSGVLLLSGGCGQTAECAVSAGDEHQNTVSADNADFTNTTDSINTADSSREDVIVVMGPSSEPEAGFDPVYGWGRGSMCTNR